MKLKLKVLRSLAWYKFSAKQKFGVHKVKLSEGMVTMVGSARRICGGVKYYCEPKCNET